MAGLALNSTLSATKFAALLKTIEREIHQSQNCVRYAMNGALSAFGVRNAKLAPRHRRREAPRHGGSGPR